MINMTLGDPHIWERWYDRHNITLTSGVDCLYLRPGDVPIEFKALVDHMHSYASTILKDRILVSGLGSTQTTIGIMYALAKILGSSLSFWEQAPRYMNRRPTVELMGYKWTEKDPD